MSRLSKHSCDDFMSGVARIPDATAQLIQTRSEVMTLDLLTSARNGKSAIFVHRRTLAQKAAAEQPTVQPFVFTSFLLWRLFV